MPDVADDLTTDELIAALNDPRPLREQPRVQQLFREMGREDLVPSLPPKLTLVKGGNDG